MEMKRRTLIKGAAVVGAAAAVGGGAFALSKLSDKKTDGDNSNSSGEKKPAGKTEVFQNVCTRNCYSTCSLLSTVEDGVLKRVEGNPKNTYTGGAICSKGNSYPGQVYSPDRIKYPMKQEGRGTGKWKQISWDEAYTEIAQQMLKIKKEYGSMLPICYNWYSGNFNILNYSIDGLFSSVGYVSKVTGTPCWPAGIDAQTFDFGAIVNNDPEDFVNAKYMILWGTNGAWTAMQTMRFVEKAKENGCKIIAIDPILTSTAAKADLHIQINTSTDGALALGMARYIIDNNLYDEAWLKKNSLGYEKFFEYVKNNVTVDSAAQKTGVPKAVIEQIAKEYATTKPANIWIGYGMQRHINGGHNVRAIDALAAITGNIGVSGGGANYAQLDSWGFSYNVTSPKAPEGSVGIKDPQTGADKSRPINMNNFAAHVMEQKEPPIKMLWLACRNSAQQDPDSNAVEAMFKSMDFVVTADLFMTKTVELSDIVLPVTSIFETPGIGVSYWHYWVTLNERAIKPLYEAKHDLEIAMGLSAKLNELEKGSCTFPTTGDLEEWVEKEFTEDFLKSFGMKDWKELKDGPKKMLNKEVAWKDGVFRTESKKYEFTSAEAVKFGHEDIPMQMEEMKPTDAYPVRCISPHWKCGINGQFQHLDWMKALNEGPFMEIHPELAMSYSIKEGDKVKISNEIGEVTVPARITQNVPKKEVVIYEMWMGNNDFNINRTVKATPADMGAKATGMPGISFHDNFVKIEKVN